MTSSSIRVQNFIGGKFLPPLQNQYLTSYNPSNGQEHAQIPISTTEDVNQAVIAAQEAFVNWSKTSVTERSKCLLRIADLIEENVIDFARMESRDQGKPYSMALKVDIPRAIYNFRFFASAILHSEAKCTDLNEPPRVSLNYTRKEPIGVAGLISPWNLPLYLLTWKIAPCIATGNTCVCKPSEFTSCTAYLLCDVLVKAGLPSGVVNVVFGDGPNTGSALVQHPSVPLVSFTGGTATGAKIAAVAAPLFKKLSLELGGKNAALVFADTDFDRTVSECVRSAFTNNGQVCLCTSRIFIQDSIYERFCQAYVERVKQLVVGDPFDEKTNISAVVSKEHREKILFYIELAKKEGGVIECGGSSECTGLADSNRAGYYVRPTVITGLPYTARCMKEEIFGPVVCLAPFSTVEEGIHMANSTPYGLAASVWTNHLTRAHQVAAQLKVGTVWINSWMVRDLNLPFGGYKESGIGREGWPYSLDFFTEEKAVCIYLGA